MVRAVAVVVAVVVEVLVVRVGPRAVATVGAVTRAVVVGSSFLTNY